MKDKLKKMGRSTQSIHAGQGVDPYTGSVVPPVFQTSIFAFSNCADGAARFAGEPDGFIYTRLGNPTVARLEEAVSTLEGGAGGIATGSGMSALCTTLWTLLNQGDHLVGTGSVYGSSRIVVEQDFSRFGVNSTFVDTSDTNAVKQAIRPNTKVIFIETPSNPTIALADIERISKLAKIYGATLVVDNTFATPILQRPIELGADVVLHSMTKFINGHTDVVAGMIVPSTQELLEKIRKVHRHFGACMDPHQAWLVLRGLKTIAMRVKAAQENAQKIAEYLEAHPKIEWVRYPGLKSHPQRALAEKQMDGPGALISFEVKGGVEAGTKLLDNVKLMTLAVSLGGIETLIQHPSSMTHKAMSREMRLNAGITDGLVRLSVGCEDAEDLIADLENSLKSC